MPMQNNRPNIHEAHTFCYRVMDAVSFVWNSLFFFFVVCSVSMLSPFPLHQFWMWFFFSSIFLPSAAKAFVYVWVGGSVYLPCQAPIAPDQLLSIFVENIFISWRSRCKRINFKAIRVHSDRSGSPTIAVEWNFQLNEYICRWVRLCGWEVCKPVVSMAQIVATKNIEHAHCVCVWHLVLPFCIRLHFPPRRNKNWRHVSVVPTHIQLKPSIQ